MLTNRVIQLRGLRPLRVCTRRSTNEMNDFIAMLLNGLFLLLVICFIRQLTRMSLRERLHAMLGPTMLAVGIVFLVGPIHFDKTVERTEKGIHEQFSSLLSETAKDPSEKKVKEYELHRDLEALIKTAKGVRQANDIAAYTFFVCGILTVLSTPWKFGKVEPGELVNASSADGLSDNHLHD